jgi:hypothetical protein
MDKVKEEKYLVIKLTDIDNYLTKDEVVKLYSICDSINLGRLLNNKKRNSYIVINEDEKYSEKVWDLILKN